MDMIQKPERRTYFNFPVWYHDSYPYNIRGMKKTIKPFGWPPQSCASRNGNMEKRIDGISLGRKPFTYFPDSSHTDTPQAMKEKRNRML